MAVTCRLKKTREWFETPQQPVWAISAPVSRSIPERPFELLDEASGFADDCVAFFRPDRNDHHSVRANAVDEDERTANTPYVFVGQVGP